MKISEVIQSNHPVQVMFYDGEGMAAGIMWGDQIFCGCCGGTFWVDEVVESAREDGITHPILMYTYWVDLCDDIRGYNGNNDYLLRGTVALEVED